MPPPRERRTTPLVVDIDGQQLSTSIDPDSGTHYIDCHRCGDSITLTVTGHLRNFYNHINGTVCKKNLSKDGVHNTGSRSSAFHLQTSSSSSVSPSESPISSVSGIISSFSNLHASSPHGPHPTPVPEILDSRVLRPHASASASHASAASIPSIQIPKLELCPGVEISWAPGSIWSTYPYHQHLIHTIGWTPASFNKTENKIYLRSDKCAGELSEFDLSPCMECRIIPYSSRFEDFMQRAKEAMKHTPWDYLTSEQLQGLAKRLVCNLKKLRTQVSRLLCIVLAASA
jgi:hypothetical protein